jgi:flagellar hook-associated protein 3 FlgL
VIAMTISRVTHKSMSNVALRGLQGSLARTQSLQNQLSSGRRVNTPGDDPSAAGASMKLRSQRSQDDQYLRNIQDASGRLNVTDDALVQISDRVRRARDLLVQAGNGAVDTAGMAAIGAELSSIQGEVKDLYNTRWLDRPVFAGTAAGNQAIDATGSYVGNDAPIEVRISRDATLRVDTPGTAAGAGTLPDLLGQAAADVPGNPAAVSGDLSALDTELGKVLKTLGDVGARSARLETTKNSVDAERLDFTARISENEDVDLPSTIMNLQSQQVAYQTALSAAAKILQTSLVEYLR